MRLGYRDRGRKIVTKRIAFCPPLLVVLVIAACTEPANQRAAPVGGADTTDSVAMNPETEEETLVERGKRLELDTPYSPPPGDIMAHYTMGFARTLCSGVFVTGLDEDFAAENIGYFTSPYETRSVVVDRDVDHENKTVSLTMENGVVRTAKYIGDLGCVPLPIGETEPYYEPPEIVSALPAGDDVPWPMGDVVEDAAPPPEVDMEKINEGVDLIFDPDAMTAAVVVTYKGQIIAERYGDGIDIHTPLESWSMSKSLSATLLGVLINQGIYELEQPAPIPEWQGDDDPRQSIRIQDILHMSSGLRCRAPQDPDADIALGYYDHLYLYTGTVDSFQWAASRPQQWEPNTVGRYRNCDPVLTNYLVRLGVEGRGDDYHQFPQQHLFDKIGVRNMVTQTDPYGNFLLQGAAIGAARDWARIGNLYLNDGMANGERVLAEGFVDFVSTLAPAWVADGRPIYGGLFWLDGADYGYDPSAMFSMRGAGGQMTQIIPSHDMVVVRLGHYKGSPAWQAAEGPAMRLFLDAVAID